MSSKAGLRFIWVIFYVVVCCYSEPALSHEDDTIQSPPMVTRDLDFRLPAADGRSYSLDDWKDFNLLLLVADSASARKAGSPNDFVTKLQRLPISFHKKVKLIIVDSSLEVDRSQIESMLVKDKLEGTVLFDPIQIATRSLNLQKCGDFVFVDPQTMTQIPTPDDVETFLEKRTHKKLPWPGREVANLKSCDLPFAKEEADQNSSRFLQSFSQVCLTCHVRTKDYDYFKSVDDILGWKAMSLQTIRQLRMPWIYDPHDSPYANKYGGESDLRRIVKWLQNPPIISEELRTAFVSTRMNVIKGLKPGVELDNSPLILKISKPIQVPAGGGAIYKHLPIGLPFAADTPIQAISIKTNSSVAHHINLIAAPPGYKTAETFSEFQPRPELFKYIKDLFGKDAISTVSGKLDKKTASILKVEEPIIATFGRAHRFTIFPDSTAYLIPKGTQLILQLHLQPSGRAEIEETEIQLYRQPTDKPFQRARRHTYVPVRNFKISPNSQYQVEVMDKLKKRIRLFGITIHMHFRGAAARVWVRPPGQPERLIAHIPFFQSKARQMLEFGDGLEIEAGSTIHTQFIYDNTVYNPANPDPKVEVKLGGDTYKSEMHFPRFYYVEY